MAFLRELLAMGNSIIVATFSQAVGLRVAFAGESDICFSFFSSGLRATSVWISVFSVTDRLLNRSRLTLAEGFALTGACIGSRSEGMIAHAT
jgi:hypothetical protein